MRCSHARGFRASPLTSLPRAWPGTGRVPAIGMRWDVPVGKWGIRAVRSSPDVAGTSAGLRFLRALLRMVFAHDAATSALWVNAHVLVSSACGSLVGSLRKPAGTIRGRRAATQRFPPRRGWFKPPPPVYTPRESSNCHPRMPVYADSSRRPAEVLRFFREDFRLESWSFVSPQMSSTVQSRTLARQMAVVALG